MQGKDKIGLHTSNPRNWVANYADYLFGYAITHIGDEQLARDLVQETFLSALERVDGFEGRSSEKTWLTAIMKKKVIDIYRKRSSGLHKRSAADLESMDGIAFFNPEDGHWNDEHRPEAFGIESADPLETKELKLILERCLAKLPPLWFSVFTMKHMDEEGTEVICRELRISSGNFWVIIHRAKVNLRACLEKNWI